MKANNSIMKSYFKCICVALMMLGMSVNVWGDETLTLTGTNFGTSGSGYADGPGTASTSASTSIDLEWNDVLLAQTPIQLAAGTGEVYSTSSPTTNNIIKSITVTVTTNTINLYGRVSSSDTWSSISYTSGTAQDVSSYGYKYFRFTSTSSYAKASSVVVVYTSSEPHTVTFSATSGTPASSSSLTEASGGAGVTLPNVTPSSAISDAGWGFYGWATSSNKPASETTTAPTIVGKAGDTYYPGNDITLYAVYAKGTYTKVTSTSGLTNGGKFIVVGYDNNNTAVYAMTSVSYTYNSTVERLKGKLIDTSPATTYSAAVIHANWRCEITYASTNQYYIQNLSTSKYVDTQCGTSSLCTTTKYGSDHYTITYANGSDGYCSILNNESGYGGRYLVVFVGGDFGKNGSACEKMMIYKETTAPKYVSAPCTNIVTLSEGSKTNVSSIAFSESGVQTCSSTAADRNFTVTVTTNTGYEVTSSSNLTFSKSSGTATASYVSGPTGSGPYAFTYRFAHDDSGAGTFSATATAKTYTITLNGNGATTEGTANVTATYNSATLSSAITNPKKTHYIFQGWYSGSGGTGNLIIDKDGVLQANVSTYTGAGGIWTKDGGTTLYAKWTEHTYTNYKTVCCDPSGLAFDGEHNYQTLVRQDIAGAHGGNGSATEEQGKATLVLDYNTESSGTCTVEVKKLTGGDNRSTAAAGSDCSNHTTIAVDGTNKKVTFEIWTYAPSYPTANGQGTYRIKLSQATASTYCATDVYYFVDVTLRDKFVDAVNGNSTINVDGQSKSTTDYYQTPEESDLTETNDCDGTNRRLRGWISEMDLKSQYGTPGETGYLNNAEGYNSSKVVAPDADIITSGCTWYAVWGVEK